MNGNVMEVSPDKIKKTKPVINSPLYGDRKWKTFQTLKSEVLVTGFLSFVSTSLKRLLAIEFYVEWFKSKKALQGLGQRMDCG